MSNDKKKAVVRPKVADYTLSTSKMAPMDVESFVSRLERPVKADQEYKMPESCATVRIKARR